MAKLATITMVITTLGLRRELLADIPIYVLERQILITPPVKQEGQTMSHTGNWDQRWDRLSAGCSVLSLAGLQLDPAFLPPCGFSSFVSGYLASFICSPATPQMPLSADIASRHRCCDKTPGNIGREDCVSRRIVSGCSPSCLREDS